MKKQINNISFKLLVLLLTVIISGCTNNDTADIGIAGTGTPLSVQVDCGGSSRSLLTDGYIPSGSIGVTLVDGGGTAYDGTTFNNLKYTTSDGSGWTLTDGQQPLLTATVGKAVAYYPYLQHDNLDMTAVPVVSGVTDYLYSKWTGDISDAKPAALFRMQHAMAGLRFSFVKVPSITYSTVLTGVRVTSDTFHAAGTLDATTGDLTPTGNAGATVSLDDLSLALTTTQQTVNFAVVPGATSGTLDVTAVISGVTYTTSLTVGSPLQSGLLYDYALTLEASRLMVQSVTVMPWGSGESAHGSMSVYTPFAALQAAGVDVTVAGDAEGILFSTTDNGDGTFTVTATASAGGVPAGGVTVTGADAAISHTLSGMHIVLSSVTPTVVITMNGRTEPQLTLDISSSLGEEDTDIDGVQATVTYSGGSLTVSDGQTVSVPMGTEITVTYPNVAGYLAPSAETFIHTGTPVTLSAVYRTELVRVTLSADNGADVSAQTVTIIDNKGVVFATATGNSVFKIPYGMTYSVSSSDKLRFMRPAVQTFTATDNNRIVTVVYTALPLGVYIQGVSGELYSEYNWSSQETPNGIAVITSNCQFVVALEDAYNTTCEWGAYGLVISGITTSLNSGSAQGDYKGEENTSVLIDALSGNNVGSVSTVPAAEYCYYYRFPNKARGYLGAAGEWQAVLDNKSNIDSAITKCGGTAISGNYWTSTQKDSQNSWYMRYSYGQLGFYYKNRFYSVRAFTPI